MGPIDWPAMKRRGPEMARFDRGLDAPVAAAGVAHRGEAAVEHGAQPCRRARGEQGQRQRLHEADVDLAVDDVHVAVDQPRHQRAPAAVDDVSLRRLDRLVAPFPDRLAFDQQLIAAAQLAERGLEQLEILEQQLGHQCSRFLWKRPPFMMTARYLPCSWKTPRSLSGLPSIDQQIGEGAGLQAAELADLAHDLGADQGGGSG